MADNQVFQYRKTYFLKGKKTTSLLMIVPWSIEHGWITAIWFLLLLSRAVSFINCLILYSLLFKNYMRVNIKILDYWYRKLNVQKDITYFVKTISFSKEKEKFWSIEVIILDWKLVPLSNDPSAQFFNREIPPPVILYHNVKMHNNLLCQHPKWSMKWYTLYKTPAYSYKTIPLFFDFKDKHIMQGSGCWGWHKF